MSMMEGFKFALFLSLSLSVRGFLPGSTISVVHGISRRSATEGSSSALRMGSIFDSIQKFFSGEDNPDESNLSNVDNQNPNRIVTIPVKAIKPGGLRMFFMFYLMAMQNTPDRNAWKTNQPSREGYAIDFCFHDRTAMLSIELFDDEIAISRIGTVPSTAYIMQETVILQGLLDELHKCAFDESVEEANRLLQLSEPKDAIEQARNTLAFG